MAHKVRVEEGVVHKVSVEEGVVHKVSVEEGVVHKVSVEEGVDLQYEIRVPRRDELQQVIDLVNADDWNMPVEILYDVYDVERDGFKVAVDRDGHVLSELVPYEGTSFSGRKCFKRDHLSTLMLSCLLTEFDGSSVTVKFTHNKCNISSDVHLVVFQAGIVKP